MTELITALDFEDLDQATKMVDLLGDDQEWYKVGMELHFNEGRRATDMLREKDKKIFLDLKLYDVKDTIEKTVLSILKSDCADMITICALHIDVMFGADRALCRYEQDLHETTSTKLIGVGCTTGDVQDDSSAIKYADQLYYTDMNGMVSSAHHVAAIKEKYPDMITISPGIRYALDNQDCHATESVATPKYARDQGCDYIVVGRPITKSEDPVAAWRSFDKDIQT